MSETAYSKRLKIVFKEFDGATRAFAKALGISDASVIRMMQGVQPINGKVNKAVIKMGYSAEWFVNGTGTKKKKVDTVKLITEIGMLRTEMDIMLQKNNALEARMKAYEGELKEIKEKIAP